MTSVDSDSPPITWQCSEFGELTAAQLYQILKLRQDVFILEQACLYPELDDHDQEALHLAAWRDGELLAYLRALPPGGDALPGGTSQLESTLGRVVVSPGARGLSLGRELTQRGIALNLATWPGAGICIGAQAHLEKFYVELGFESISDVYDDEGIPHIKMRYRETA
jgi:ElaA protein